MSKNLLYCAQFCCKFVHYNFHMNMFWVWLIGYFQSKLSRFISNLKIYQHNLKNIVLLCIFTKHGIKFHSNELGNDLTRLSCTRGCRKFIRGRLYSRWLICCRWVGIMAGMSKTGHNRKRRNPHSERCFKSSITTCSTSIIRPHKKTIVRKRVPNEGI